MKIGNIDVRISIVAIAVVVVFAIFLSSAYLSSGDTMLLLFGIPAVVLLLVIPDGAQLHEPEAVSWNSSRNMNEWRDLSGLR